MKKWFDRNFQFNLTLNDLPAVYARLGSTPARLEQLVRAVPEELLIHQPEGKWSAKEHAGHLSVLEPLWQKRFVDISGGAATLTPADLENRATTEAGFNKDTIIHLVNLFTEERQQTMEQLKAFKGEELNRTSLHPRLQQQMRIIDLAYFVAEHDDHHLEQIRAIIQQP